MNKIIPFIQENISIIKENIVTSSITILSSLIIVKIFVVPMITGKKKPATYSKIVLHYLMNCYNKYENMKPLDYILIPLLNKKLRKLDDEEYLEDFENQNDTVAKINKSKKIIKKLTKDFIKEDAQNVNQYGSQKDKIFYLLLNNIHFLKDNHNKNLDNENKLNFDNKNKEIENS